MATSSERLRIQLEAIAWLGLALGHQGSGRLVLEQALAPGTRLIDLLGGLAQEHPGFADYALGTDGSFSCAHLCVTLNGSVMSSPQELASELHDGDRVVILPAFSGG